MEVMFIFPLFIIGVFSVMIFLKAVMQSTSQDLSLFRRLKRCKRCQSRHFIKKKNIGGWKIYQCCDCNAYQWKCGSNHWFANDWKESEAAEISVLERKI